MIILFRLHTLLILLPFWHSSWSIRVFGETPCAAVFSFKNISMLSALPILKELSVGKFEKRSMHSRKYTSLPCSSLIGPTNSICFPLFGSPHGLVLRTILFLV